MIHLDMVLGPACVRCGCQDVTILAEPQQIEASADPTGTAPKWNVPGRAACNHCGTRFPIQNTEPAAPVYGVPLCPDCGSDNTKCRSSPRPKPGEPKIRYHICLSCQSKFSTEEPPS